MSIRFRASVTAIGAAFAIGIVSPVSTRLLGQVPGGSARTTPQVKASPTTSVRLYIFDLGVLGGAPRAIAAHRRPEELAIPVMAAYLIVHPKGTLLWDAGGIPDALAAPGASRERLRDVIRTARPPDKTLKAQLAEIGYSPTRITYFALSHHHDDHTGNANDYRASTWLVQRAERDAMFAEKPPRVTDPTTYSALKDAKTVVIENKDHDVFGDGTVVLKFVPGHTPGNQALLVKLARTGPVLLSGDLYHFLEEFHRPLETIPGGDNWQQTADSRLSIAELLQRTRGSLWVQHDPLTFSIQKKSPLYYD